MPRLSVVMIVKNEAHCLADCLDSVRGIADEIVVGDTGSTDATPDIARERSARVFDVPWTGDFAAARNTVLARATGGWLLHLDADEVLDPEAARQIRDLVDRDGGGCDAVELVLRNYCNTPRAWRWRPVPAGDPYARGFAGCLPVALPRLFRAGRGFEYREPVHENIAESLLEHGGRVRASEIPVHHYGYDPDSPRAREKVRHYLDIARRKLAGRPADLKALHDVAEQALACGFDKEAETACRRAIALDPCSIPAVSTLANILLTRGNLDEARVLLETVAANGRPPAHVAVALAAIDFKQGRLGPARRHLECALNAGPESVLARLYLARVLDCQGQPAEARRQLDAAEETAPALTETRDRIAAHELRADAESQFQAGNAHAALDLLVRALRLDAEDPLLHNDLGVVLHALGEADKARECFGRALQITAALDDAAENLRRL